MNLFRETSWKWWELKIIAFASILIGLALGAYFGDYLNDWLWIIWSGFVVLWLYVMFAWARK